MIAIKDIIGPEWNISKKRKSPCPRLFVWVPKKDGFTEFVKVNEKSKLEGGFSIAIFCHALHVLPYSVQPIFIPFVDDHGKSNGDYDQLVKHIENKVHFSKHIYIHATNTHILKIHTYFF